MSTAVSGQASAIARVLVIKHGALGDFVQALGPMAAIRTQHKGAHVVLMTTPGLAPLGQASGWADEVWIDDRPRPWRLAAWARLRRRLRRSRFDRVYDLQTSNRSSLYFQLMGPGPRPEWSGIARGASHPHANPERDRMHTIDRQAEQLAIAGIAAVPPPDLAWLDGDVAGLRLPEDMVLLVPGGARHRPEKRWPVARYAALARRLVESEVTPVLIGGAGEAALCQTIAQGASGTRNLAGRTDLLQVAGLARRARVAIGNDTGPMHIAAVVGCPSLVLFSNASDPARCAPRGPSVGVLRRPELSVLTVDEVWTALADLLSPDAPPAPR
ncbi:MAG: glycosyltransferase family 9 protein [Proteobacteria bacterium]|nr:glycosyltransferase family 9 protein [Pseudomonadota bacterium]MBI3497659.1 glycosyltransferase family 9 protein [Pseudomonadota bacterium]